MLHGNGPGPARSGEGGSTEVRVAAGSLPESCRDLRERAQARLLTMIGTDERARGGAFRLRCAHALPADGRLLTLVTDLPLDAPRYASLTPLLPAAEWHEREIHDLLGLLPEGHPDLRPLVRHAHWPATHFPLRKDAGATFDGHPAERAADDLAASWPPGLTIGPLPAGIGEPGLLHIATDGRRVERVAVRLFYAHRGVEKLCEGRSPRQVLEIVERTCGACTFANALAFCRAAEACAGIEAPPRAHYLRAAFLEIERLLGLIGDCHALAAACGLSLAQDRCSAVRESLLRLSARCTGSRLLRGLVTPGGMRRDVPADAREKMGGALLAAGSMWQEIEGLLVGDASLRMRLRGLAVLPAGVAEDLAVVGPAAAAAGKGCDARLAWPDSAYRAVQPEPIVQQAGDAEARLLVRLATVGDSFRLLAALLGSVPEGAIAEPVPAHGPAHGIGIAESARGESVCWLAIGSDGLVERMHLRAASYTVWPAMLGSVAGIRLVDLPAAIASFGLCVACVDR